MMPKESGLSERSNVMIHRVYREEYDGLTTGLELPVRGDINNGHRHSLQAVEEKMSKMEERITFLANSMDVLVSKIRSMSKNEKERED